MHLASMANTVLAHIVGPGRLPIHLIAACPWIVICVRLMQRNPRLHPLQVLRAILCLNVAIWRCVPCRRPETRMRWLCPSLVWYI